MNEWIDNRGKSGSEPPCDRDAQVHVRFANGEVFDAALPAHEWYWGCPQEPMPELPYCIVEYRIVEEP